MKKFFVEQEKINGENVLIDEQEFVHLSKVLRCEVGEKIVILCGDEFEYVCQISEIAKHFATAKVLQKNLSLANPNCDITLFQGLAKGEKMEFITQKCTELGIKTLQPFESDFTVAKNTHPKFDRWEKISQEACKQSGRTIPLEILPCKKIKDLQNDLKNYDLILFLYEHAPIENKIKNFVSQIQSAKKIAIIIGAEGGFSENENQFILAQNATPICLGKRILRTETASVAICGFVSFLKNN